MKTKIIVAIAALFITTNLTTQAQGPVASPGPATGRAEGIYNEYATATGGKISFIVQTLSQGPLSDLAGRPFSAFLVEPTYRVESDQDGTELTNVSFIDSVDSDFETQELSSLPDQFEHVGLPLQMGVYRRLGVTVAIGADSRSYESMEFCWGSHYGLGGNMVEVTDAVWFAKLTRCRLLDPVVVFLQSKVENRMRLIADGWGPQVTFTRASDLASGPSTAAVSPCGLLSDLSKRSITKTWPTISKNYLNLSGALVVQEKLGQQSVAISCDLNCHPQVTVSSSPSTATGFLGWTTACANIAAKGTTGSQATGIAETKCTRNPPGAPRAKVSVTISGAGTAGVNRTWSVVGTADPNGGRYTDTCSTAF